MRVGYDPCLLELRGLKRFYTALTSKELVHVESCYRFKPLGLFFFFMAVLFATDNPCHYEVSRQDTNYVVSTIYDHHVLLLQQFSLLLFIDALGRYQDVLLAMRSNEKVVCPEVFSI